MDEYWALLLLPQLVYTDCVVVTDSAMVGKARILLDFGETAVPRYIWPSEHVQSFFDNTPPTRLLVVHAALEFDLLQ